MAQGFRCPGVMELTADSVGWGPKNPVLAAPRPEPKGRPCPKPEGLCAHGAGLGAGWGGLASGRCFSPSVGRQRLPLSLSWDFAAGLPLSAALELIPSAEVRHLLPRAFLTPAASPPFHLGSAAGQTARRGRSHVGEAPAPAGTPAPGRPEGASASGPGPPPARNGVGQCSAPPRAALRGPGARGGRGASGSGRRSHPPRCAVRSGWRGGERAGAEPSCGHRGAGGASEEGVGATAA